jgi:hypothetical protein
MPLSNLTVSRSHAGWSATAILVFAGLVFVSTTTARIQPRSGDRMQPRAQEAVTKLCCNAERWDKRCISREAAG